MSDSLQELLPPQAMAGQFDVHDPAEILHEQTKFHRATLAGQVKHIVRYLRHPAYIARGAAGYHDYKSCPRLDLPEPQAELGTLAAALAARKSVRSFAGSLSLQELSSLLHHTLRVNRQAVSNIAPHVKLAFRPYPSPGGLYPTEFYLYLNQVDGVAPCITHYDARAHCLRILKEQDGQAFARAEVQSGEAGIQAPVALVMTSLPQRATAKYGSRGYRMALLEAGHAAQNLCLAAQGLGLAALMYGAYYDDELAAQLDIDGVTETVVSVMLLGKEAQEGDVAAGAKAPA
jgi:SagB-type dehydrogenase family enzyme